MYIGAYQTNRFWSIRVWDEYLRKREGAKKTEFKIGDKCGVISGAS